jgi:hypothetical protein
MTEEQLNPARNFPMDEFGVRTKNMLYNKEVNMLYCILDAPNKDAVINHHQKKIWSKMWLGNRSKEHCVKKASV